jgi:glycerate-2-kinase
MPATSLTSDALAIWHAGVDAVRPEKLIPETVIVDGDRLQVAGRDYRLSDWDRIVVVGTGKAGAAMSSALLTALGEKTAREKVTGWVNVPDDCVVPLEHIHLHGARPAGVNEPTEAGVEGTQQILNLARSCTARDLCLILISGGGSALMPAPVIGITLADKQEITRHLMHAGATINELNCVRKQLSAVKGGGLARAASGAGEIVTLIISDVVGDPLDVISSGPTVPDPSTPQQALEILEEKYDGLEHIPENVRYVLQTQNGVECAEEHFPDNIRNVLIASNAIALDAAARQAGDLGYQVHSLGSDNEGDADDQGRMLAELAMKIRDGQQPPPPPACVLSGGEPTVRFAETDQPRKGGRNQQLALSALLKLRESGAENIVVLSGGTDGEDGPTDAAGAFADADVLTRADDLGLDPAEFQAIQNAYPFFDQTGGLIQTGPTNTNVMDLRVVLVST